MEIIFIIVPIGFGLFIVLIDALTGGKLFQSSSQSAFKHKDWEDDTDEELDSGYTRGEYYEYGLDDIEIEFWGLDQPGAPAPEDAGSMIWEMVEEIDW